MTEKFKGWVSTEFLTWNPKTSTFIGEASDIGINRVPKSLIVWNPKTMGSVYLELSSVDESEGEVMGWRFVSHKGYNLIIVND